MVVGMLDGYSDPSDRTAKAEHYKLIQSLALNFENENKSIICRELLDLSVERESPYTRRKKPRLLQKRPDKNLLSMRQKY